MAVSSSAGASSVAAAGRGEAPLRGPWLRVLQGIWIVLIVFDLATLVMSFAPFYQGLHSLCPTSLADCTSDQLTRQALAALQRAGFSLDAYALYVLALDVLTTAVFLVFGALIFWRRPNTWMGLFVSFFLINLGALGPSFAHSDWLAEHGSLLIEIVSWGGSILTILFYPTLAFFFFMYPDGRLVPRWSWTLISLWIINAFFWISPIAALNIVNWHPLLQASLLFVVYGGSLGTQVYRYWRVASPLQRQQIKWLFYGYTPVFLLSIFGGFVVLAFPALGRPDSLITIALTPLYRFYYLPVPICVGIALLRYRLWDIDTLINRTLVYGSLTAILLGTYLLLVFAGQSLLVSVLGKNDPAILVAATLAVAALFQPLRRRVQQFVDRRFYRKKYDATRILASFAATLYQEIDLDQLNTHLVGVIKEAMQPTHISLWLCPPQQKEAIEQAERLESTRQETGTI